MALFNKKTDTEAKPKKSDETKSMKELYEAPEAKASKTITKAKQGIRPNTQAFRVLVRPLITEKGTALASLGKYLFEVAYQANKIEVAKAIEDLYGIRPEKVNLIRMEGKVKSRGRVTGKRKDWKKAMVTLPKGKTIDVYEGV